MNTKGLTICDVSGRVSKKSSYGTNLVSAASIKGKRIEAHFLNKLSGEITK